MFRDILFFDFEIFSESNLLQEGSARYARDPSTEGLMVTWSLKEGPVHYADLTAGPFPLELRFLMADPSLQKCAANIRFDKDILEFVYGINLPWEECLDFFALAYSQSFSGGLESIGVQMDISEDVAKMKAGKKLILRFCKLQPSRNKVRRWTRENSPEEWEQFKLYAIRDTESMRALWLQVTAQDTASPDVYAQEREYWIETQKMNDRGLPVDPMLVDQAIKMAALRKGELKQQMIELTGLDNPNSGTQLIPWLAMQGIFLPNLQAATVDNFIEKAPDSTARDVLQLKRTVSQTAVTKWGSIRKMLCPDNTLKGMFIFSGASRTGRDASRGVNLQNLRHPPKGDMDELIKLIYFGDNRLINMVHGEPLDFLARTVRGAITAPINKMLVVSDLSSIESRVLGWVTGCRRMQQIFAENKDTYKDFAMELFNCRYDEVTKQQRNFSKPPVLGAGYMMGAQGLKGYAEGMGTVMTIEESRHAVDTFRTIYPEIPQFWSWLFDAWNKVVNENVAMERYGLRLEMSHKGPRPFLTITLPSGRKLMYLDPRKAEANEIYMPDGESFTAMSPSYFGLYRNAHSAVKWQRIHVHAGGLAENIIQAIARDVLLEWAHRCRALHIVARIHDEFIAVVEESIAEETLDWMNLQAAVPMPWPGGEHLLLNAEGFVTKHYTKD